jgi:DNA-binding CsgD family transcriptional regulator
MALTYGLELVHHGAMLVTADGQLQAANSKALAILQKKDGIFLTRNRLTADRACDTRVLHKLLSEAVRSPQRGEPKESPIALRRKQSRTSLIVRVVPAFGLEQWRGTELGCALLRLYDPDICLAVDEQAAMNLYGLTRGEAALAGKLVQGKSIEDASAELFISTHTARTHLKRIFMKTDTHRQPELVARMLFTTL